MEPAAALVCYSVCASLLNSLPALRCADEQNEKRPAAVSSCAHSGAMFRDNPRSVGSSPISNPRAEVRTRA